MSLVRCVFHDVSGWISDGKARSLEVKYVSRVTDFFAPVFVVYFSVFEEAVIYILS